MECKLPTTISVVNTMLVVVCFISIQQMQTLPQGKDACGEDGVCNCSSEGKHYRVTCAGRNLTQLPEHIPFNTAHLNISWNQLGELPQDTRLKTRKLKELDLSSNQLKNLPEHLLRNAKKLRKLFLDNNTLQTLPRKLLSKASLLKRLFISRNNLNDMPGDMLQNTKKILTIDLSYNQLETLSENLLQHCRELNHLMLSNNNLKTVGNGFFSKLRHLESLDLSFNRLAEMDANIMSSLKTVWLLALEESGLHVQSTNFLSGMSSLKNLYMAHNRVDRFITGSFREIETCLQILDLADNNIEIKSLRNLSTLRHLKILDLSGSRIIDKITEDCLWSHTSLEMMALNKIGLADIPYNLLAYMEKLTYLTLDKNHLVEIRKKQFSTLKRLRTLSLSWNRIKYIEMDSFSLPRLELLILSYNELMDIPQAIKIPLYLLDLSGNMIQEVNERAFTHDQDLEMLLLSYNNIHSLADNAFSYGITGKIYLFGNKLTVLSNRSFSNENITEIHLYGNNLSKIQAMALSGTSSSVKVYIDCNEVHDMQQPNTNLICVTTNYVPRLQVPTQAADIIERYGFKCGNVVSGTRCHPCPRGSFGNGRNECIPCPRGGFYLNDIGMMSNEGELVCSLWSNGTFVRNGGGKSVEDCTMCPDGTNKNLHAGYRACFCLHNYARTDRFGACFVCRGSGVNCSGKDYISLKIGYFWSWDIANANLTMYRKFVENLNVKNGSFDTHTNYTGVIPPTFKCPRQTSCRSSQDNLQVKCSEGYTGWLCSKCDKHFYLLMNYCYPCPDKGWLVVEVLLYVMSCVIIYTLLRLFYKQQNDGTHARSIVGIFFARVKILLGFYQIVGEFLSTLRGVNLANSLKFIGNLISLIELNILRLLVRPQCFYEQFNLNPRIEFAIALGSPIAVISISYFIYHILITKFKCKKHFSTTNNSLYIYSKSLKSRSMTIIIVLLFVTYPPTCTLIFQLYPLACDEFCLEMGNNTCKVLLRSDYDIECKDLMTDNILAYIATVGYVMAFPACLLFLLRRRSPRCLTKVSHGDHSSVNSDEEDELQPLLDNPVFKTSYPGWVVLLCENYKPQYWYWEIVELARKATQTALITMLGWEDKMTELVTICVSVLFLTLHARYMPMKNAFEQRLQMFSLTIILVNVLVAAMDLPDEYDGQISVFLVLLNISVIAILAGEVVFGLFIRLKHMKIYSKSNEYF